jgi:hypothetical protein
VLETISIEINKNIRMMGNSTKNHAKFGAPALQIKLRTQVQNNIYMNLMIKIIIVLETLQL